MRAQEHRGDLSAKATLRRFSNLTRLSTLVCGGFVFALVLSCTRKSSGGSRTLEEIAEEGEPLRLALLTEDAFGLVRKTQEELQASQALIPMLQTQPQGLSGNSFRALNWSAQYAQELRGNKSGGEGSSIRYDSFQVNTDLSKVIIAGPKSTTSIPFGLSKGSEVLSARIFPNEKAAQEARPIDLSALPLQAEAALKMAPGSYFGIPSRTTLFANVSSQFLQKSSKTTKALSKLAEASLSQAYSGVAEAHLLASGEFQFHIFRLPEDRVRVRVTSKQSLDADGTAKVSGTLGGHYLILGSTVLTKLKDIALLKGLGKPKKLSEWTKTQKSRKDLALPLSLAELERFPASPVARAAQEALGLTGAALDKAVEKLDQIDATVDQINEQTTKRFNDIAKEVNSDYLSKMRNALDKTLNLEGSVEVSAQLSSSVGLLADYEFDLSFPAAQAAYDRLVSGRVVAQGRDQILLPLQLKGAALNDFSLADELSLAPPNARGRRPVTRKAWMEKSHLQTSSGIQFKLPQMERNLKEKWSRNEILIKDDAGKELTFALRKWDFDSQLKMGADQTGWSRSSGLITDTGTGKERSAYLYALDREHPVSATSAYKDSLTHMINVLGSAAFVFGVPDLFTGEHPGDYSFSGSVTLAPEALELFFDNTKTTPEDLWRAFGRLAAWVNYDNQMPTLANGDVGAVLSSDAAKEACKKFEFGTGKSGLGEGYCLYFQKVFLTKWLTAAKSQSLAAELGFLEGFYSEGFLANKFGGDLMIRLLIETLYEKLGKDATSLISLRLRGRNSQDASGPANPSLDAGRSTFLEILEALENPSF